MLQLQVFDPRDGLSVHVYARWETMGMSQVLAVVAPDANAGLGRQADTDIRLVNLWLHGRSVHTQRAYRADIDRFLVFVAKPLPVVTLGDLQAFADALAQRTWRPARGCGPSPRASACWLRATTNALA